MALTDLAWTAKMFSRSRTQPNESRVVYSDRLREPEAVNAVPREPVGFFAQLTDAQKKKARAYDGPDEFGDPRNNNIDD